MPDDNSSNVGRSKPSRAPASGVDHDTRRK
jgi:hypothetical protein